MSFTNYLEHKTLDHLFGNTTYTASGTLYLGLSTTTPAEDGTNFTEPGATGNYSRLAMTNNKTNWSSAAQVSTSGEVHNMSTLSFAQASNGWGTVTYFGIFDGSGGSANLLTISPLSISKTIDSGDTASFASGALSIRLD